MQHSLVYNENVLNTPNLQIGGVFYFAYHLLKNELINSKIHCANEQKKTLSKQYHWVKNFIIINISGVLGNYKNVNVPGVVTKLPAVTENEEVQNKRLNMQKFYHELAHRKVQYDDEFYHRAKSYGLDLTKKCQALLVDGNVNTKAFRMLCEKHSHYCDLDNNKTVFFNTSSQIPNTLLKSLKENQDIYKISLGGEEHFAAISVENAELSMEFGIKIKPSAKVYNYCDLKFFIHLSYDNKESLAVLFSNIDKSGNKLELLQTIQIYVEENGDINNVANRLNIHRNTLNYRLERIKQMTGKNPKVLIELFELLCGLIWR